MGQIYREKFNAKVEPYIYNWRPGAGGNLSKWTLAMAKMRAKSTRPKCLMLGTSKLMGAGAGTTDGTAFTVGAAAKTKSRFISDILNASGIPCSRQSVMFCNGFTTNAKSLLQNYDPRVSFGTNWTPNTGIFQSIGGLMASNSSPNVDALTFTPDSGVNIDTVDVLCAVGASVAQFTVSDGVTTRTFTPSGANSLGRFSASLIRGTGKTISIARTIANSNTMAIAGIIAYDSTVPAIELVNAGRYGAVTSDLLNNSQAWGPFQGLASYAPDLTTIGFAANELNGSNNVPVATFKANVQSLITQAKLSGDVVLVVELMGSQPSWGTGANQALFIQTLYDLADANDVPLINENGILSGLTKDGGFTIANGLSLLADSIHENDTADSLLARPYAQLLAA